MPTEFVNTLVVEAGWLRIAASGSTALLTLVVLALLLIAAHWLKKRA